MRDEADGVLGGRPHVLLTKEDMDGDDYVPVYEGRVTIRQPKNVFYNKVQEFNRDLR